MKRCDKLVEVGRRGFLTGVGVTVAGAAGTALAQGKGGAKTGGKTVASALVTYPATRLGNVKDLKVNVPLAVAYPDKDAPGVLLKLGKRVSGGVGPDGDIVGFTTVCPHAGFPLGYRAGDRTLHCPGHYSVFDVEMGGSKPGGRRRRTCRSRHSASMPRATCLRRGSMNCSTGACRTF
jgi:arsenite oxidase small subunit